MLVQPQKMHKPLGIFSVHQWEICEKPIKILGDLFFGDHTGCIALSSGVLKNVFGLKDVLEDTFWSPWPGFGADMARTSPWPGHFEVRPQNSPPSSNFWLRASCHSCVIVFLSMCVLNGVCGYTCLFVGISSKFAAQLFIGTEWIGFVCYQDFFQKMRGCSLDDLTFCGTQPRAIYSQEMVYKSFRNLRSGMVCWFIKPLLPKIFCLWLFDWLLRTTLHTGPGA